MEKKMTDDALDAAAAEALGMNAGTAVMDVERDMRETVARLSAAAPYMAPPADLRGRILQATAPATFRMEDYKKVNHENSPIYKWGFYAAACFLIAAAWFNINAKNQLQQTVAQANLKLQAAQQQTQAIQSALLTTVAPKAQQIRWVDKNNVTIAHGYMDLATGKAVVIMPPELVPAQQNLQLTIKDDSGKTVAFDTTLITVPSAMVNGAPTRVAINSSLNEKELTPDTEQLGKVYRADMRP